MKKLVYSAAIICMVLAAASCKSTKAEKKASNKKAKSKAKTAVEAPAEEQAAGQEAAAEAALAAGLTEGADAAAGTAAAKNTETAKDSKDYTGWIKSSKKNLTERFGKVQIKIKSGIGSYTIAVLNDKDKPLPVLSTANEYVTNAFFLKNSKKTYNLITDSAVRSSARQTSDGAVITYEIPSVAQVSVYFSCMASQKKKDTDMIKATVTVKNLSDRNDDFAFKALFDTVLGEAAAFHFYTWEDIPVKSEVLYRTLQNQKWFVSKNTNAAMQLFFSGADCTVPEIVALANYATLEKNSWEPDMLNYRVFDTVLSYNNSAVCSIWKAMKLAPSESGKIVFYIALSGDGTPATGEKYIYSEDAAKAETESSGKSASGLEIITPFSSPEVEEAVPAEVTEFPAASEPVVSSQPVTVSEAVESPAEIPSVDFYIQNMSKEQLTPEYIQALLDRIAALEEDSPSLNRQELLRLNAELDAILTYLRQ